MKMKCIGGLANGRIEEIDNYYTEHDQVRIMLKIEFNIVSFEEDLKAFRENKTPDHMTVPYEYYKVAIIPLSRNRKLKFLIPMKWDIEDALCFMLGA